ncbi:UNVERIFIED_ORG: hypothetical protein FHR35_003639 [Microbispora rosea subsp. rosea]
MEAPGSRPPGASARVSTSCGTGSGPRRRTANRSGP